MDVIERVEERLVGGHGHQKPADGVEEANALLLPGRPGSPEQSRLDTGGAGESLEIARGERTTCVHGQYGGAPPSSQQRPATTWTSASAAARLVTELISRVRPIPGARL